MGGSYPTKKETKRCVATLALQHIKYARSPIPERYRGYYARLALELSRGSGGGVSTGSESKMWNLNPSTTNLKMGPPTKICNVFTNVNNVFINVIKNIRA